MTYTTILSGYLAFYAPLIVLCVVALIVRLRMGSGVRYSEELWKDEYRKERRWLTVCGCLGFVWMLCYLLMQGQFFNALTLLVIGASFAAGIHVWNKRAGSTTRLVCARCGYDRPDEHEAENALCPECGNSWWSAHTPRRLGRPAVGAVSERVYRSSRVTWRSFIPAAVILPLVFFGRNLQTVFYAHAPFGTVVWLSENGGNITRGNALVELLSNRTLSQPQADALLDSVSDYRDTPAGLPYRSGDSIEAAIASGLFGAAALDRFYSDSIDMRLEAVVSDDGTSVHPRVVTREYANTIYLDPSVVSLGFRINDGPYYQPVSGTCLVDWFSYAHEDYFIVNGGRPFHDRERPGPHYKGYQPHTTEGLAPGTHTITARVHLYVLPRSVNSWGHQFFAPDGTTLPHPQSIWHETIDLTAEFELPEGGASRAPGAPPARPTASAPDA